MPSTVTVLGAGSWGTTIAKLLTFNHNRVVLYCRSQQLADEINQSRLNSLYFPNEPLPSEISAVSTLEEAFEDSDSAYLAIPSLYLREFFDANSVVWEDWAGRGGILCNCVKGLLLNPTERIDSLLERLFPRLSLVHLSGPNLAGEIMQGLPTAAVAAGPPDAAEVVQRQIMCPQYRVYTTEDATGVEVAGFYKNIMAIAAGAVAQLELGENTQAVLVTRALAEMGRLVEYFGGERSVLYGLAGMGDLIATCSSPRSRNFQVGKRLAAGEGIGEIIGSMTQVAEGVQASKALQLWPHERAANSGEYAGRAWPELPIAAEVYRFVHEGVSPKEAISALMSRPPKAEGA
jgi:glycerol-3-phosphate dehydrogenase (NAD(P)+)